MNFLPCPECGYSEEGMGTSADMFRRLRVFCPKCGFAVTDLGNFEYESPADVWNEFVKAKIQIVNAAEDSEE